MERPLGCSISGQPERRSPRFPFSRRDDTDDSDSEGFAKERGSTVVLSVS